MSNALYFDLISGASGDMILSSLISAGVPVEYLQKELSKLQIEGLQVDVEHTSRDGISAAHLKLDWKPVTEYRHLEQLLSIIKNAHYPDRVYNRCERVLIRLGKAEAAVHGIPLEEVHFHEIGAVDTIIDIAGASLCLEYLDVDQVYFSEITDGHGSIKVAHGVMPVPVPATAKLIEGLRFRSLDIPTELLTPTGAALLTTLGRQVPGVPAGTVLTTGYGSGTKQFANHPNLLRVLIVKEGPSEQGSDIVYVLESDMDHVTGEIMAHAGGLLMEKGALDVTWIPVFMKKGRPAYRLSVLCKEQDFKDLIDLIIIHTRTLGVRYHKMNRVIAARSSSEIEFMGAKVAQKECSYKGHSFTKLEYDALALLSKENNVSVLELMDEYVKGVGDRNAHHHHHARSNESAKPELHSHVHDSDHHHSGHSHHDHPHPHHHHAEKERHRNEVGNDHHSHDGSNQ